MMRRVVILIALIMVAASAPAMILIPAICLYAFLYRGVELVALAVFIDAYFMPSTALIPFYTLGTVSLLIFIEFVKPYLFLYNQTD